MMADDIFDFGFTAVDEQELEAVQQIDMVKQNLASSLDEAQGRLDKLYNAIQPLLNNLKANPEKEYIYWPQRLTKVESFSDHLDKIYSGTL
jgi:regulator of replication initiation timing